METSAPALNPEIRQLFLEEAEQKAADISKSIAELADYNPEQALPLDHLLRLQMRFSECAGLAATLGLTRSGQTCAVVVDELTQVIGGAREAEDSLPALFDAALEAIDDALAFLHGNDIEEIQVFGDINDHEPKVAEQLPQLDFPALQANPTTITQTYPAASDSQLVETFLDEAEELLELAEQAYQNWPHESETAAATLELKRVFHTLKGGARLTQMPVLGDYVHDAEDDLQTLENNRPSSSLQQKTRHTLDQLNSAIRALKQKQNASLLMPQQGRAATNSQTPPATTKPTAAAVNQRQFVRVRTPIIEALRQRAGEVNTLRKQIQQVSTALQTEQQLSQQTLRQTKDDLRKARFALERLIERLPSTFSSSLNDSQLESQMALQTLEDLLLRLNRQNQRSQDLCQQIEQALGNQNKAGFALQENILSTRLVPFSDFSNRLQGCVRQTLADNSAPNQSKNAELIIEGGNVEVDRHLLEQLLPALEHMLRNAVVHGIETESKRRELGKQPVGQIRIQVSRGRGRLQLTLSDDGAGLAEAKILQQAQSLGLVSSQETLDSRRIQRLIFHPGLSAADKLSQSAGRGVGMDIVEHAVHSLGGSIDLHSEANHGSQFSLRLPMGETAIDAIVVRIADELYAIPQQDIRHILRLDDASLSQGYQANKPVTWNGQSWALTPLSQYLDLGDGRLPGPNNHLPALLINSGEDNIAMVVDHCNDSAEYSLETLPAAVTGVVGIGSAIILEDGQIAPVLDLAALHQHGKPLRRQRLAMAESTGEKNHYKIMVVDDSSTWRRQLSRQLQQHSIAVSCYSNGVEALAALSKESPQLLIVDLEMPRIDGLEFLQRLRRNPKFAQLPVIMFSTVTHNSQRHRAKQLGAKAWVVKNVNLRPLMIEIDRQLGTHMGLYASDRQA